MHSTALWIQRVLKRRRTIQINQRHRQLFRACVDFHFAKKLKTREWRGVWCGRRFLKNDLRAEGAGVERAGDDQMIVVRHKQKRESLISTAIFRRKQLKMAAE
jgi:hypothetical protein